MHRVGVDFGGTKIEAVLLDGRVEVARRRTPTPRGPYGDVLDAIAGTVADVVSGAAEYTVGVCMPGSVSGDGVLRNGNMQHLNDRPVLGDLEGRLGRPVSIGNDANCFAMAEASMGAGAGYGTVFGATLGTGVGGGIVTGGRLHEGRNRVAGEWGHHALHVGGRMCYCGRSGCAEAYISGPALEARWEELTGERAPLPEILPRAGGAWKEEFLDNFGHALANVIDILDPDVIVLGGGVSNAGFLYTEGRDSVYDRVFSDRVDTPILRNRLGDSAGALGAALLPA